MDLEKMKKLFEEYSEDEYIEFDRIKEPLHPCPDVCAFILLHRLAPSEGGRDLVSWAEHDEIGLATDVEALARVATEESILMLVRCGVRFDSDCDMLKMFV